MRRLGVVLLGFLLLFAIGAFLRGGRVDPNFTSVDANDTRMNAAIEKARASLPDFWVRHQSPQQGETGFVLKIAVPTTNSPEHIWVESFRRLASGRFVGVLANDPHWIAGKKSGDEIEFSVDQISDWGFQRRGKLVGYETTRVLIETLPRPEAERRRQMFEAQ